MNNIFKLFSTILAHYLVGRIRYIFRLRKRYIAIYDTHNINVLKKQFVEPYIQEINPANTITINNTLPAVKKEFKSYYKEFNDTKLVVNAHGGNTIFILGDAGTGKTALSTMLLERSLVRGHFFPNKVYYLKLGRNTIQELKQINNPPKSTIILDALDEDAMAFGRYEDRITDLLDIANKFYRCIITCRTQFFPDSTTQLHGTREPMKLLGYVQFGQYNCRVFYLSPFDDKQVDMYLKKFYKYKSKASLNKARDVIDNIGDISSRPLILSYIDVITEMSSTKICESDIYDKIISFWLNREIGKEAMKKRKIGYTELFTAVNIIAEYMAIRNVVTLEKKVLLRISKNIEKVSSIKHIDVSGRTLLQKDHDSNYMFAHRSFLEYLVASSIVNSTRIFTDKHISVTDKMLHFIKQKTNGDSVRHFTNLLFHDIKLDGAYIKGFRFLLCDFVEVNFTGVIDDVLFSKCTFNKCSFDSRPSKNIFKSCKNRDKPSESYQPSGISMDFDEFHMPTEFHIDTGGKVFYPRDEGKY